MPSKRGNFESFKQNISRFKALKHRCWAATKQYLHELKLQFNDVGRPATAKGSKKTGLSLDPVFMELENGVSLTISPEDCHVLALAAQELPAANQTRKILESLVSGDATLAMALDPEASGAFLLTTIAKLKHYKSTADPQHLPQLTSLINKLRQNREGAPSTDAPTPEKSSFPIESELAGSSGTSAKKRKSPVSAPTVEDSELSDTDDSESSDGDGDAEELDDVDSDQEEDSFSMVPLHTKLGDAGAWGDITRRTRDMVLLPQTGRTLIGYGHRPSGLR